MALAPLKRVAHTHHFAYVSEHLFINWRVSSVIRPLIAASLILIGVQFSLTRRDETLGGRTDAEHFGFVQCTLVEASFFFLTSMLNGFIDPSTSKKGRRLVTLPIPCSVPAT